MLSIHLPYFL